MNIESKHDFTRKLRQSSVLPIIQRYIEWQRSLRAARANGNPDLPMPEIWPISINLDPTTGCNYRCDHCTDWNVLNTPNKHDDSELWSSLRAMQEHGLKSVILIGGGEPTVYSRFSPLVRYLKELGLQVAIVSNGSNNRKILEVADCFSNGDWARLSLDAGTNDTFVRMHRPVDQKLTLEGICEWVPKIKAANSCLQMAFSFLIVWDDDAAMGHNNPKDKEAKSVKIIPNIHEFIDAVRLSRDSGFDYIALKPFLERGETGSEVMVPGKAEARLDDIRQRIRELIEEARQYETETFKIRVSINLRMMLEDRWREFTNQPRVCHKQALQQVLTPYGLYNCPAYRGVDYAKIAEKNAYANPLNAHITQANILRILNNFDAHERCANVTCFYNDANWSIERAIEGNDSPVLEALPDEPDFFF